MMSYCSKSYAECLVTTLFQQDSASAHCAGTCNGWTAASGNAKLSCAQPVASKQPRSNSCGLRDLSCHAASRYHTQMHNVDELNQRLIDVWCSLEQSIFDETIDQWWGRRRACVHAKGGHIEYSLWTDNVDFVHICYIQCDWFHCYIFNYEIIPATLANIFLFILQGSALADFRYGGRF